MWTVAEAKAKLSNVLERAREGELQVIGTKDPCVVISMTEYKRLTSQQERRIWADGWSKTCVGSAKSSCRPATRVRPSPFADWTDEDFGE